MSTLLQPIKLFISYSHDDDAFFKVFSKELKKASKGNEHISWDIWDDRNIYTGTYWDDEIQNQIKDCNVALLLVSNAFLASKYIKEKEFGEFLKKYTQKNILIIPIVFKPCRLDGWVKLSEFQFFKPNGADYGKPEIEDFTYSDLIKFRDTDGIFIPNPNSDRYILNLIQKIESSFEYFFNPVTKRAGTLIDTIGASKNHLTGHPIPSPLFTGRLQETEAFEALFESHRIIAIEGLGGTGKTQFAAKCIEQVNFDKEKITWLDGSAQSNFDVFVERCGYGDVLKGKEKTDRDLYSGLKDLIEKDERLIFWDNFNDYRDKSFAEFLDFANQYLQKATIILITKTEPSIAGLISVPLIKLEGLSEDAIDYARKLQSSNSRYAGISDEDLNTICAGVEGHPLAIELSMYLMGYGKSAEEILNNMPSLSNIRKVEDFAKRLFFDIFDHPNTTDQERTLLLNASVFKGLVGQSAFDFINGGSDAIGPLSGLIDKLLISQKQGFYELHPLIRNFCYEKLTNKKLRHKQAADFFIGQRSSVLRIELEEKIFYHLVEADEWIIIADSIESIGKKFIQQGQLRLILDLLQKLINTNIQRPIFELFYGDIFQIRGEWNEALIHYNKASLNEESVQIKAEGIVKIGEVYFRRGDVEDSLKHFDQALTFSVVNAVRNIEACALNDIGLAYYSLGNFDLASKQHKLALAIHNEISDPSGLADIYNNLGNLYLEKKKFNKAIAYYNWSKSIWLTNGDTINLPLFHSNIANTYVKQQKFKEALVEINIGLDYSRKIGDKANLAGCLLIKGMILIFQGNLAKGISRYKAALKIAEEIGDKRRIAGALNNIGVTFLEEKNYSEAIYYFFRSLSIASTSSSKAEQKAPIGWIEEIQSVLPTEKFKEIALEAHDKLAIVDKKYIEIENFVTIPLLGDTSKVGRNDLCPCGSLKKYKNCHGKSK